MQFSEYETESAQTAIYPGKGEALGLAYAALGLSGEAGEIANKARRCCATAVGN